ncbi:MAG: hypothetical protein ABI663_17785 [Chryseolinea sp.]
MAKAKKKAEKKSNRPDKYEKSTLEIKGTLDEVLKVSFAKANKQPDKKS